MSARAQGPQVERQVRVVGTFDVVKGPAAVELFHLGGEVRLPGGSADVVPPVLFGRVADPEGLPAEDEGVDPEADFGGEAEEGQAGVAGHAVRRSATWLGTRGSWRGCGG